MPATYGNKQHSGLVPLMHHDSEPCVKPSAPCLVNHLLQTEPKQRPDFRREKKQTRSSTSIEGKGTVLKLLKPKQRGCASKREESENVKQRLRRALEF